MAISESRYRPFSGREGAARGEPSTTTMTESALYGPVASTQAPRAPGQRTQGRYQAAVYGQTRTQESVAVALEAPGLLWWRWDRVRKRLHTLRVSSSDTARAKATGSEYDLFERVKRRVEAAVVGAWDAELSAMEAALHLDGDEGGSVRGAEPEPPDSAA